MHVVQKKCSRSIKTCFFVIVSCDKGVISIWLYCQNKGFNIFSHRKSDRLYCIVFYIIYINVQTQRYKSYVHANFQTNWQVNSIICCREVYQISTWVLILLLSCLQQHFSSRTENTNSILPLPWASILREVKHLDTRHS